MTRTEIIAILDEFLAPPTVARVMRLPDLRRVLERLYEMGAHRSRDVRDRIESAETDEDVADILDLDRGEIPLGSCVAYALASISNNCLLCLLELD